MRSCVNALLVVLLLMCTATATLRGEDGTSKAAPPDVAAQAKAVKLLHEIYTQQYADVTPAGKRKLAQEMLDEAGKSVDDATSRFMLLCEARDLATQGNAASAALEAIDQLDKTYAVDAASMKVAVIVALSSRAAGPDAGTIADAGLNLMQQFIDTDDYGNAGKLGVPVATAVRQARDEAAKTRLKDIQAILAEWDRAKPAIDKLKTNAADAASNLAAGHFYCFGKADFDRGLPLLAKGSDDKLKNVAAADLANPTEAARQVALGDGWYDWAESQAARVKAQAQGRAAFWYRKAQPRLSGLAKIAVDKRLAQLEQVARANPVAAKNGPWLDLLKQFDTELDVIEGRWTIDQAGLTCGGDSEFSRIGLPATLDSPYELEVRFVRHSGDDTLAINFPAGAGRGDLILSSRTLRRSLLNRSDQEIQTSQPAVEPGTLENGHEYTLNVRVIPDKLNVTVAITLDGNPYMQFAGPQSALVQFYRYAQRSGSAFGVGVRLSKVTFTAFRVRPLSRAAGAGLLRWEFGRFKVLGKTSGNVTTQNMSGFNASKWEDNDQLWWTGGQPGDKLRIAVPVAQDGAYEIFAALTKAPNYGIVQMYFDNQKIGTPVDLYDPKVIRTDLSPLGRFALKAGEHVLTAEITGSNRRARPEYMFGLDTVRLKPAP
jgi:hypothetical protein